MEMKPVKSSNIAAVGHDGDVLRIKFLHGGLYEYVGIEHGEYVKLIEAPSIGAHFSKHIRAEFVGKRIQQKPEPQTSQPEEA